MIRGFTCGTLRLAKGGFLRFWVLFGVWYTGEA